MNHELERFAEFMAAMIEKYGEKIDITKVGDNEQAEKEMLHLHEGIHFNAS